MWKETENGKDDGRDQVLPTPSGQSVLSLNTPSVHTTPIAVNKHTEVTSNHDEDTDSVEAAVPNDLAEPHSVFTKGMRIWIVLLVSMSALISPFGATTFLPAMNVLREVLDISASQVNVAVTTYMIAQAFAPAFMGALSDSSGRRLAFIICFIIFFVANIGLALQTNYIALLLLRILQAMGGTAGIALSYAVVADVSTSAERGVYMGYAGAGILAGPAFGPTIGGILAQYLGWRSTFWFLVIYAGVLLVLFVFFFPETCRNIVGNGSIPPSGLNRSVISCIQARKNRLQRPSDVERIKPPKRKFTLPNPLVTFRICLEKESGIILLYNGLFFTAMMTTVYGIPYIYGKTYNLSELHLGLCFIANGVGSMASSLTMGHIVDWNFRRHAKLAGMPIIKGQQQDLTNFNIERVRLEIVLPSHVIGTIGLLIFGWTVHYGTHIAFPEIGLVVIGFGISGAYNITNNLLIDLHRDVPAATTAAVNFARCLLSAGGAAAIIPMVNAMGVGWTFTFMAAVSLLLFGVAVWIMKFGMAWRLEKAERGSREMEEKERGKGP